MSGDADRLQAAVAPIKDRKLGAERTTTCLIGTISLAGGLGPLFQSLRIGSMTLRNRIVVPPMQRGFVKDRQPNPAMAGDIACYGREGAGLVFSEGCALDHPSLSSLFCFAGLTQNSRGEWKRVADAVRTTDQSLALSQRPKTELSRLSSGDACRRRSMWPGPRSLRPRHQSQVRARIHP